MLSKRCCFEVVVEGHHCFMSLLRLSSALVGGQIRLLCMNFWNEIIMAVETGGCWDSHWRSTSYVSNSNFCV